MNEPDTRVILSELWGGENLTTIDPATGIVYADVEKTIADKQDDNDCWLAAASNIMFWGGWVTAGDGTIANEDRFFDFAVSCWGNKGGYDGDALYWWVNGTIIDENYSTAPQNGGNRLPQLNPADYLYEFYAHKYDKAEYVCKMIDAGFGVTLGIYNDTMSHAITCWGYERIDGKLYFYYSDSDDDKNTQYTDRRKAPDSLKRTQVTFNAATGEYKLADYDFEAILRDLTAFAQYDVIMTGSAETLTDTRKTITIGTERRGRFDATADDDAYRITASGSSLALAVSGAVAAETAFTVELYDKSGVLLASQSGTATALNFAISSGGVYYLRVIGNGGKADPENFLKGVYSIYSAGESGRAVKWNDVESSVVSVAHGDATVFALADHAEYFSAARRYYSAAFVGLDAATEFYGGSLTGETAGDCRIYFENGRIKTLYGGGNKKVSGNISIVTSGDTILASLLYGGGKGADITGKVNLNLNLSKCTANIYGGSFGAAVGGDISISIGSGQLSGLVFGGGRASAAGISADTSNIYITLAGSAVSHTDNRKLLAAGSGNSAWVVGGGQAVNGGSVINSTVNITVKDGAQICRIVGGAQAQGENSYAVVNSVAITVSNATVTGNIFGGGYARNHAQSTVLDNVTITVDSSLAEVSLAGNIYLGGTSPGYISTGGDTTINNGGSVVFSGSGELLNFSGTVSGDGTVPGTVAGMRTLEFKGFHGEFSGTVKNFDMMTLSGGSSMSLGCDLALGALRFQVGGAAKTGEAMLVANGTNWSFNAENAIEVIFPEVFDTTESREFILLDSDSLDTLSGLKLAVMFDADTTLAVLDIADGSSSGDFFGSFSLSMNSGILALKFTAPLK